MKRTRFRRPEVRRAVVLLPNGFTLFNLFCGIYAIVLASRGRPGTAALFIVIGGVADSLDGRIARATGTGSRFGEELDSLVDAISFGLAPAIIMFFAALKTDGNDWIYVFIFASCAVIRLARFNVEQAGRAKTHFHGLPSPAAGMTLATYYWFSQTSLYNDTVIFFTNNRTLAELPWHTILRWLMVGLAYLMVSDVPYPAVPTIGYRSTRQLVGTSIVLGSILGLIFLPREFIFPALVA
jgi:CDP-diacylglycerol---serine O-phosphatidyltransferase